MSKRLSYEQYKNRSTSDANVNIVERNAQVEYNTTTIELRERLMDSSKNDTILDNYDDTRAELRSTGHNLTSVLMNPRETFLDDLMDEFASEQNTPVDFLSFQDTAMNIFNIFASPTASVTSSSSALTPIAFPSSSNSTSASRNGSSNLSTKDGIHNGITSESLAALPINAEDSLPLKTLLRNMRRIFREYQSVQKSHHHHNNESSVANLIARSSSSSAQAASSSSHINQMRRDDLIVCFNQVPAIYFKNDFSLRDSDIFQFHPKPAPTSSAQSNYSKNQLSASQVHDRLSMYLDVVETSLFKQIWSRSPDFFKALDDLSGLRVVVAEACGTLAVMRSKFRRMDNDVALTSMRIPLLHIRYKNEKRLHKACEDLKRVKDNFSVVQSLLRIGDYVGALQLANEMLKICNKDLRGVKCIAAIQNKFKDVEKRIGEKLVKKFIDLALDWNIPISTSGNSTTANDRRLPRMDSMLYSSDESEQDPLTHVITALVTAGMLDIAINEYKNRLCDNVRLIVRTCVTEYMSSFDPLTWSATLGDKLYDDSNAHYDTPFAQRVRGMNSEDFLSALSMCVENLLSSLQRTADVHTAIMNMASRQPQIDAVTSSSDTSKEERSADSQSHDGAEGDCEDNNSCNISHSMVSPLSVELSRECVIAACDLAQRSISQLLKIRRDNTARLAVEKMKFLSEMSRHFLITLDKIYHQQGIEVISSTGNSNGSAVALSLEVSENDERQGINSSLVATSSSNRTDSNGNSTSGPPGGLAYELSKTLRLLTRAYMDHMQDSHKQRLVSSLDSERWVQSEVTADRQIDIDRLVSGRSFMMSSSGNNDTAAVTVSSSSHNASSSKTVTVDGVSYRVVWSCLLLIEQLVGYLNLSTSLCCMSPESVTKEVIPKIVELLKLFETRTKLLVLGAGAIQSAARLKSISAKHLATTIQSLGLIKCLIPHIRAALLASLNTKYHMLLSELDRVANDYIDHHSAIISKLVTIAGDSVETSANKLRGIDWDRFQGSSSSGSGGSTSISGGADYFEDIVRNISALHRVLFDSLSLELLQDIFNRIFALLARRIPAHMDEYHVSPNTQTAKQRITDEVIKMTSILGKLKGIESSALNTIVDAVIKKYTAK